MSDPYERIVEIDAVRRAESIYGGPVGRGGVIDDDRGRPNIFGLCHAPSRWPKVVQKGVKGGLPAPKSAKFGVVGLDEVRGGVGGC